MNSANKVYAGILNEKLMEEIEKKMKEGLFRFRRGRRDGCNIRIEPCGGQRNRGEER